MDTKQLNPVKEYTISPALTTPIHNYNLTQIMRQGKENPLIILLETLRKDIEHETSDYKDLIEQFPENMNERGEGYHAIKDPAAYAAKMSSVFQGEDFKMNKNHCRHISWTNDSITNTSAWLRNKVYKYTSTLEVGEILLSYKTIAEKEEIVVVNSDDYIVEKITDTIISDYTYPLHVHSVILRGIDTGATTTILLLIRDEENYNNYKSVYNEFLSRAKAQRGKAWVKFYDFKGHVLVIENLSYTNEFRQKELIKKDIDYGYGITAHKSQGSTYHTVFVNYKDISNIVTFEKNDKRAAELMKKRLLYVALSRASNEAYLYYT